MNITRKEAIDALKKRISPYTNCAADAEANEVIRMAIKALKQGDVLEKIRAEIEQAADKQFQIAMGVSDLNERYTHLQMENAYRHSLNVIDKYRTESEDK